MFIVKYRKIFFTISAILISASLLSIAFFGLNFGIDFTGGALMEVRYPFGRPGKADVSAQLNNLPLGGYSIRPSGEEAFILRTRDLSPDEHKVILQTLSFNNEREILVERFTSVGPSIGAELASKALVAIGIVVLVIVLFVAFAFRKVNEPVSSWKYGIIAIVALLHDIIVPTGLFAILGAVFGAEVDALFIMALLVILGYSVNDTIVVFDRVRENLRRNREMNAREDFELTVGKSLNQTFTRSINTSLTTILALLALFFLGAPITQNFTLVLITGIVAGTYSSIALATPLLVVVANWRGSHLKK